MGAGFSIPQGHVLGPSREVGVEPVEGGVGESNEVLETVEEDVVVYRIKRSREVEENEEGWGARVRGHQEVTGDSDEGCFCAVGGTETGLEFFIEFV